MRMLRGIVRACAPASQKGKGAVEEESTWPGGLDGHPCLGSRGLIRACHSVGWKLAHQVVCYVWVGLILS